MDKRTILAFVLIGLIIILYPHYMEWIIGDPPPVSPPERIPAESLRTPPSRPQEPPVRQREIRQPEIARETLDDVSTGERRGQVTPGEFIPQDVVIETDLFTATFSTRGGVLTRLRLKAYEHPDGGQLDLIAPGSAALGLSLAGESLDAYEFSTDTPRLTLVGAEQAELIFTGQVGRR